jgi:hypothetical protein
MKEIDFARDDEHTITEWLKESFRYGYEEFEPSRIEAEQVENLYHNRQWTIDQLSILETRGQPKETFNVIKLFTRMLIGYYSTVVNNVVARPMQQNDIDMANLATDLVKAIFERNHMDTVGNKIKMSAILSGLMVTYTYPEFTNQRDRFGRPLYRIAVEHCPSDEVVIDPMSTADDYSDGRWIHRYKWVPEGEIIKSFGRDKLKKLEATYNYLEQAQTEIYYKHPRQMMSRYRVFDNYLLTHTVVIDNDGRRWSIYWCGNHILRKKEITHRNVKWGYRVVKTHTSNIAEYYGIFREVVETQKAINQAIVKLQLMANSQKVFVQKGAVEDIDRFTHAVNRVTGVIPVLKLTGIKLENMAREAMEQYEIIDRAFDRIQRVLSVNDSFLGMAFASDSGRKVKLQQNATIMALQYLTERIQLMYRLIGEDVLGLANQYITGEQAFRVTDEITGQRFIELNKPMEVWTGQFDPEGAPIMSPIYEQVYDPEDGKPMVDDDGALVFAPIPEEGTELNFNNLDLTVESVAYNDEDEKTQLLIESVLSGNAGQMLAQVNPGEFFRIAGLTLRVVKTRYSQEIAAAFDRTAQLLQQDPQRENMAAAVGMSLTNQKAGNTSTTKLPEM